MPPLTQDQIDDLSNALHSQDAAKVEMLLRQLVAEHLSANCLPNHPQYDDTINKVVCQLTEAFSVFDTPGATLIDIATTFEHQISAGIEQLSSSSIRDDESLDPADQITLHQSPGLHTDTKKTLDGGFDTIHTPASDTQRPRQSALEDENIVNRFGDYELLNEIARGGMGIVYKARQIALNRVVAIKMILSGQFANNDEMERFYAEAEAAANLNHANIVTIYEIGQVDQQHFFSMEYVPGDSLSDLVREHPLADRRAAGYAISICDAVQLAHDNGILHRDLKPANVLINEKDVPLVTDFGLAKQVHEKSGMTMEGSVLGTPSYMPPEQARGNLNDVDVRCDVYSIGATLYELITGTPPFSAASVYETIRQVINTEPTNPRHRNPDIGQDLATIVMKCLHKSPDKRYQTAQELKEELERFVDGHPILARPIGKAERLTRWCRRNPLIASTSGAAIAGVISMLVTMTVAYFVTSDALVDANKSFERSKQTVDDFFVEVTENELLQTPNTRAVREAMLDKALQYYVDLREQRAGNRSDERSFQQESADLEFKMGQISEAKNNPQVAKQHYANAIATIESLLEQSAEGRSQLTQELTNYMTPLIRIHAESKTPDFKRATELSKKARNHRKIIYEQDRSNLEHGRRFANACMNLGSVLKERHSFPLAEESLNQAQDVRQQLLHNAKPDAATTSNIQRDISKGYYQLARLKNQELRRLENQERDHPEYQKRANAFAASEEQYLNLALDALVQMQHNQNNWESISEDDHLQSVLLLTTRLERWLSAEDKNRPTMLDPQRDIEHGLKHIASLMGVTDRPEIIGLQIRFQITRLQVEHHHQDNTAIEQTLNDVHALFDAGAYKHTRHETVDHNTAVLRRVSLAALSHDERSYARFVESLELTMHDIARRCEGYSDKDETPLLTNDWKKCWIDMQIYCPEVAENVLGSMTRIVADQQADKTQLLELNDWLTRIQNVDAKVATLYDSLPEETTAGLYYLLPDETLAGIDKITGQLNKAVAQITSK